MAAHFDTKIAPICFVRHGGSCARAKKTIQNQIARLCTHLNYLLNQFLRLFGLWEINSTFSGDILHPCIHVPVGSLKVFFV